MGGKEYSFYLAAYILKLELEWSELLLYSLSHWLWNFHFISLFWLVSPKTCDQLPSFTSIQHNEVSYCSVNRKGKQVLMKINTFLGLFQSENARQLKCLFLLHHLCNCFASWKLSAASLKSFILLWLFLFSFPNVSSNLLSLLNACFVITLTITTWLVISQDSPC